MRIYLIFFVVFFPIFLFSQDPATEDIDLSLLEDIENEIASGSFDNTTEKSQSISIDAVSDSTSSNLIQFNKETFKQTEDIYPMANFKGTVLYTIPEIEKSFDSGNFLQVKASLDRWYQNDRNTFPVEGYIMLMVVYDQIKMYNYAINLANEAVFNADNDQRLLIDMNLSQIFRHSGQNQKALDILNKFSDTIINEYPEIFFYKGLSYLYLQNTDLSILNLRKYLEAVPNGVQSDKVRRAVAWLLVNSRKGTEGDGNVLREENLEKMLQLLMDKQLSQQVGELIKSTESSVDSGNLNIEDKALEDFSDYTQIVE